MMIIDSNMIKGEGVDCLGWFSELEYLDIGDNFLENVGAQNITKLKFPKLKTLKINSNQIEADGIQSIHNFSQTLEELDSGYNHLKEEGLKVLCKEKYEKLTKLNIENNNIKGESLKLL